MFEIDMKEPGRLELAGRLDAAEADAAEVRLKAIDQSVVLDCSRLEYISSAGIGILIELYKRLGAKDKTVTFVNMLPRVRNIFVYAGLDQILKIE
jgi:anti-sigma B factor antagonist